MYPYINWTKEPNIEELKSAYVLLRTNFNEAVARLERLANAGSVASLWYLGDAYGTNRFAHKDNIQAIKWFERAERAGWLPASYMLGRAQYEQENYLEALHAFERGKRKNHIPAVYRLGKMHASGAGTSKDVSQAETLLKIAASAGHLFAKRDLGTLYLKGELGFLLIPYGAVTIMSLLLDMARMLLRKEWKVAGFEERISA